MSEPPQPRPTLDGGPCDVELFFDPACSELDDDTAVGFYDAVRTLVHIRAFSELKRTDREPLDLPLLA